MDPNFEVIGILQIGLGGEWVERPIRAQTYAVDRVHAAETVLQLYTQAAQRERPTAIVRWNTPTLVRVYTL